ncbi:MAG: HlyD family efflux transporter periplasmic adaptor subunit, partial [Lentisphaeraceae bacterium]|nr:HlyD family efflux transporter periplasmic adaptor subunit [Lentisphaeraceae bacterium]
RTVSDRGMVAASKISLVQTSTGGSILFLRKNGEKVKKGEVVARVDTSNYDDDIAEIALDLKAEELTLSLNRKKAALIESSERNRMLEKQKSYEHALLEKKYEFSKPLKSTMRKLVIQLELKKLDLEEADSNLKRQTNLYNKGFLSKASLEPFERRFETAKEKVNEAKLDISIAKKGITKERRVELEQNVMRRKADLERAEKRMQRQLVEINDIIKVSEQKIAELLHKKDNLMYKLNNSTCYAEQDGYFRIRKFYDWRSGGQYTEYAPGVAVRERDVIAEIVDPSEMKVDVIFNESDFHKLSAGLKVEISLPAYSEKVFFGTLTRIGAIGKDRNLWLEELKGTSGVSMYNGEINFDAPGIDLHPGMSAMLKIYLEEPSKGLVIPRKAVIEEEGKFFVVTESKKVELTGSFINEFKFEVLSGLKVGDRVQILSKGGI